VFAEVVDTGHGIKPEHLERIFDPFFTTKQVGAGSGLGLSISKSIVTEFGGDLRVESEPGRGARFIVRLPATPQEPTVTLVGKTPSAPQPPRGRILVVDDEEAIRRSLQRLLGARHEVFTAGSGREAKALLEGDTNFDVVLCDLMMPEMTGMELHAWLVGHSPELAARVVFVSGGAFTPSADAYLQKVSNVKLEKPFEVARLLALLDERVTNRH
jgi:two-component system, NtrC family, sensor kinase